MKNELQLFNNPEFGEIRMIEVDGKPYGAATDIAKALGYSNPHKAIGDHCKGVTKREVGVQTGIKADGTPAMQRVKVNFIPEGDLYRLIVNSQLPAAEKFERWVFDEVLPAIRKTGTYTVPNKPMTDYQSLSIQVRKAQLYERLANQYDGTYKQVLHAYAAKELAGEFILPLPQLLQKTYSATEIGEKLGISANMVGTLTNRHNLKTDEYGAWFNDKAKGHSKEVPTFRYYENILSVLGAKSFSRPPHGSAD